MPPAIPINSYFNPKGLKLNVYIYNIVLDIIIYLNFMWPNSIIYKIKQYITSHN